MKEVQEEWARYKYFVMARSQADYLSLRKLFSLNQWTPEKTRQFHATIEKVKHLPINVAAQRNAYEHVWGYFKKRATNDERARFFTFLDQMDETNDAALPYLKELLKKYPEPYLEASYLLQ